MYSGCVPPHHWGLGRRYERWWEGAYSNSLGCIGEVWGRLVRPPGRWGVGKANLDTEGEVLR